MAQTTTVTLSSTYVELVDNVAYVIQNRSSPQVEILLSDAAPASTAMGHIFNYMEGPTSGTFGEGKVWGRCDYPTTVIVTK